jgi:hypothetical protein
MQSSKTVAVFSLVSLALATERRPVTIENLDPDFDVICAGVHVAGRDIYNAVKWGMDLNDDDNHLESTDRRAIHVPVRCHSLTIP